MNTLRRPDCFEFAMDFLGGGEAAAVRKYVEELEAALAAQTRLTGAMTSMLSARPSPLTVVVPISLPPSIPNPYDHQA